MEPSSRNVPFQDATLRTLKAPESGQIEYSDTLTPGLRLRVGKRSKTLMLLHTVDGYQSAAKRDPGRSGEWVEDSGRSDFVIHRGLLQGRRLDGSGDRNLSARSVFGVGRPAAGGKGSLSFAGDHSAAAVRDAGRGR